MSPTITFTFSLTAEEYFEYNYFTAWSDPTRRRYRLMYFIRVVILYFLVAALYIIANRSHLFWIDISVFLLIGTVYLLTIPYFIRWSVRRRVRSILLKKENQHVLEEAEVILSDNGITDRDKVSESQYKWDEIVHYASTQNAWYLYTNSHHAIVIPKRVVQNDEVRKQTELLFSVKLPLEVES